MELAGSVDVESAAVGVLAPLVPMLLAAADAGDMAVTSPTYRRILMAVAEADGPVRSKDVCAAVGLSTQANRTEATRGKLKKLVGRGFLAEPEPGRFALAVSQLEAVLGADWRDRGRMPPPG
jgi:hypothetical protein